MTTPMFIDVFLAPVRDNLPIQAGLFAFVLLVMFDIFFGIMNAWREKNLSSTVLREGLAHKSTEFGIIFVGLIVDGLIFAGFNLGFNGPILGGFVAAMIVAEILSLMELFVKINPKLEENKAFKTLASVKTPDMEVTNGD